MKLKELKKIIDKCVKFAENTDPNVEIFCNEDEYEITRMGQFGVVPDVIIDIELIEYED